MAATLKLQPYGCNFKTVFVWLQLKNSNLMAATLKQQSYGFTFNTAI
jgi:hypothetical protein